MFFQEEDNVYSERSVLTQMVCSVLREAAETGISIKLEPLDDLLATEEVQAHGLMATYSEVKGLYNTLLWQLDNNS